MASGWAPLAGVMTLLLLCAASVRRGDPASAVASRTATPLSADPSTAIYPDFDPSRATLQLVQVVHRHGARTPLNQIYAFGANWTHCRDHYEGVEVALHDENGAPQPPPVTDNNSPLLPGGCREGTLTVAGYDMAVKLGAWLRARYVARPGAFLPDLGPGGWDPAAPVAALRTTPYRRTIATLRGVLTGLWPSLAPPASGSGSALELPVGASVEAREIMYGSNGTCARLTPLYAAMQRDLEAADARDAELPRLARRVAEALALDPAWSIQWPKLYDTLAAMAADGAALPGGASREVLDVVWAQAERHEAAIIAPGADLCASLGPGDAGGGADSARRRRCQEVLRLGIGLLVRRLVDAMDASIEAAAAAAGGGGEGGVAAAAAAEGRRARALMGAGVDGGAAGVAAEVAAEEEGVAAPRLHTRGRHLLHAPGAHGGGGGGGEGVAAADGVLPRGGQGYAAAAAAPQPKLYVYSGHDSSVSPLLAVLGQPARAWPRFAASVVLELWHAPPSGAAATAGDPAAAAGRRGLRGAATSGAGLWGPGSHGLDPEYWVRILYDGEPLVVPGLSNAGGWVPLGVLRQRVLLPYAVTPTQHAAACARTDLGDLEQQETVGSTVSAVDGGVQRLGEGGEDDERVAPAPVLRYHRRLIGAERHATL